MKEEIENQRDQQKENIEPEKDPKLINRKEALKKTGFIALSAATMLLLLNKPDKAVAQSPAAPPGGGGW
jgi:hypothetical protein